MEEAVEPAKSGFQRSHVRFTSALACFPDDKVGWSPSSTSRNAIQQAAHVGLSNLGMAATIKGEGKKFASFEELISEGRKDEVDFATRAQVLELLDQGSAEVISALEGITPDRFADSVDLGFVQMPLMTFVHFPNYHTTNHAAQLDYMQTIYGDMEFPW